MERLAIEDALITIDAIACNPAIAAAITARGGHYLLAVKANQPNLDIAAYFADPPPGETMVVTDLDKGHGRLETRRVTVSHAVDWLIGDRRYPGEPRFPTVRGIVVVEATVERKDATSTERRYYLTDLPLTPERAADAVRNHWMIESAPQAHKKGRFLMT